MGGDEGELTAPGGDGLGNTIEEALIFVQRKFIKGDVAALAGEGIGIGGEGIDATAIGELQDVGGGFGAGVENDFAEAGSAEVERFGPLDAIFELEAGLEVVAG